MVKLKIAVNDLNGHKYGRVVGKTTIGSDATLEEALSFGHVVGQKATIMTQMNSTLQSMFAGMSRDGNGRKIDEYMTLNAFPKGSLKDITDDYTVKDVVVRARLLKELKLDPSDFLIVLEGATGTFYISTISTGEKSGQIVLGKDVALNGKDLVMGEGDSITWKVPETGATGTVAAAYVTSDETRITIGRDGLQELFVPENNGKDIVFTVKIANKVATKSASMIYAA